MYYSKDSVGIMIQGLYEKASVLEPDSGNEIRQLLVLPCEIAMIEEPDLFYSMLIKDGFEKSL